MTQVVRTPGEGAARLKAALASLKGVSGKVGWFASSKYPDGTPVAYVAAIHEYGYAPKGIPPRMGLRAMITEKQTEWARYAEHGAKAILAGTMTAVGAMELIGGRASGDIRKQISSVQSPELKESTLRNRAHNLGIKLADLSATGKKPLVEPKMKDGKTPGGLLQATATYMVLKDGATVVEGSTGK